MKIAIIGSGREMSRRAMMLEEEARKHGIEIRVENSNTVRGNTLTEAILDNFWNCGSSYSECNPKQNWQGQGKRKKRVIK